MLTLAVKLSNKSLELLEALETQDKIAERLEWLHQMNDMAAATGKAYYLCVCYSVVYRANSLLEIDQVYLLSDDQFDEVWRFVNNREHHLSAVYPR